MKASDPLQRVLFHSTKSDRLDFFHDDVKPLRRKIFVFLHESRPAAHDEDALHTLKLRRLSWAFERWAENKARIEVRRQSLANSPTGEPPAAPRANSPAGELKPRRGLKINQS